ncbi:hypothetical protein IAE29_21590 [Ochrobactrum sp. S46]|nr:hypothetical protein [Ochrobactrum sp. S45]MBK0045930.1 hypothetical protein [Ochrobactrum sp. S46]
MRLKIILALVAAVMLAGCEPAAPTSKQIENLAVEANQARLIKDIPAPTLQTSLERKNLAERLERISATSPGFHVSTDMLPLGSLAADAA